MEKIYAKGLPTTGIISSGESSLIRTRDWVNRRAEQEG
jgi:hypothetical protein